MRDGRYTPRDFPCSRCGQPRGEACKTIPGGRYTSPHKGREMKARNAQRKLDAERERLERWQR